ncbi:hypothetical protein AURDEDRAFT_177777 [Auricularia subglabra TFB-10046 SS5]|uniref:Uncharacterized protein n=1 Tax=Auricularia subglabra (strain TFB-10046 / SS5) TaxID=717982 RepID=J0D397_AURST|nr:hypothetical protein AURDEDRAFT_177777 [Auricularia subglabra TFB-10046 SS5]
MVKARERLPGRVPHDKQYDDRVDPTLVLSESSASQSDDDLPRRPTPSPATPPQFPDVYAAPKTFTHAASRSHSPVSSAATRSSSAQQPSQALPRSRHRALRSIVQGTSSVPFFLPARDQRMLTPTSLKRSSSYPKSLARARTGLCTASALAKPADKGGAKEKAKEFASAGGKLNAQSMNISPGRGARCGSSSQGRVVRRALG